MCINLRFNFEYFCWLLIYILHTSILFLCSFQALTSIKYIYVDLGIRTRFFQIDILCQLIIFDKKKPATKKQGNGKQPRSKVLDSLKLDFLFLCSLQASSFPGTFWWKLIFKLRLENNTAPLRERTYSEKQRAHIWIKENCIFELTYPFFNSVIVDIAIFLFSCVAPIALFHPSPSPPNRSLQLDILQVDNYVSKEVLYSAC